MGEPERAGRKRDDEFTVGVVCGNHAPEGGQRRAPVRMLQVVAQAVVLPVALGRAFGLVLLEERRAELIDGCLRIKRMIGQGLNTAGQQSKPKQIQREASGYLARVDQRKSVGNHVSWQAVPFFFLIRFLIDLRANEEECIY